MLSLQEGDCPRIHLLVPLHFLTGSSYRGHPQGPGEAPCSDVEGPVLQRVLRESRMLLGWGAGGRIGPSATATWHTGPQGAHTCTHTHTHTHTRCNKCLPMCFPFDMLKKTFETCLHSLQLARYLDSRPYRIVKQSCRL